jgi:hypothetical protein
VCLRERADPDVGSRIGFADLRAEILRRPSSVRVASTDNLSRLVVCTVYDSCDCSNTCITVLYKRSN